MTTSGTTAFSMDFSEILEEASARAGVDVRGGEEYRMARRAANLLCLDLANRGLNLFSIDSGTVAVSAGDGDYNLPADTVDVLECVLRNADGLDQRLTRMGVGTYASLSIKTQSGMPTRIWIERLRDYPVAHLWPIPDEAATLVYWRMRRLQDIDSPSNDPDLPFRYLPAMIDGLAYFIALQHPAECPQEKIDALEMRFEATLNRANEEDRGRESFYLRIRKGR